MGDGGYGSTFFKLQASVAIVGYSHALICKNPNNEYH